MSPKFQRRQFLTDFLGVHLTIAATRGGGYLNDDGYLSIGFNVPSESWVDIKQGLEARDPEKTLHFREENKPREGKQKLSGNWMFVWLGIKQATPAAVLLYLAHLGCRPFPEIMFRPDEYP